MSKLEQRITRITLAPAGEPIFSKCAYTVEIDDEASGEFVVVRANTDDGASVAIDLSDWPALRETIDRMVGECRV